MSPVRIRLAEPEPNDDLVEVLETLLGAAKAGTLHSITGVAMHAGTEATLFTVLGSPVCAVTLVGELELLKRRIIRNYVEE